MKFADIPQLLTNRANYCIDVDLTTFNQVICDFIDKDGLVLNPDFQRGHVWTGQQQIEYVEYILRGGMSGRDLYLNNPSWFGTSKTKYNEFVCVDGLQRITALQKFINNEIKVYDHYFREFEDVPRHTTTKMYIHINDLQLKSDVLKWYIEMNDRGTPHTKEEINRVKKMLEECKEEKGYDSIGENNKI